MARQARAWRAADAANSWSAPGASNRAEAVNGPIVAQQVIEKANGQRLSERPKGALKRLPSRLSPAIGRRTQRSC